MDKSSIEALKTQIQLIGDDNSMDDANIFQKQKSADSTLF